MLKDNKLDFGWGSALDPTGKAYNALPDTISKIQRVLLLKKEKGGKGKGKGKDKRKGRGKRKKIKRKYRKKQKSEKRERKKRKKEKAFELGEGCLLMLRGRTPLVRGVMS